MEVGAELKAGCVCLFSEEEKRSTSEDPSVKFDGGESERSAATLPASNGQNPG